MKETSFKFYKLHKLAHLIFLRMVIQGNFEFVVQPDFEREEEVGEEVSEVSISPISNGDSYVVDDQF